MKNKENKANTSQERSHWLALTSKQGLDSLQFGPISKFQEFLTGDGTTLMILQDHAGGIEWLAGFLNSLAAQSKARAFEYLDRATQNGHLELIGIRTGDPFHDEAIASFVEYEYGIHLN